MRHLQHANQLLSWCIYTSPAVGDKKSHYAIIICRPSDRSVSEDAGIEPRTVASSAVRRFKHSARSHPLYANVMLYTYLYNYY